jgi:hypothetical protein
LLLKPTGKRLLHLLKLAFKKMIGACNGHCALWFGGGCGHLPPLCGGRVLVAISAQE